MNHTLETLMALVDDYADWCSAKGLEHPSPKEVKALLQSALTEVRECGVACG